MKSKKGEKERRRRRRSLCQLLDAHPLLLFGVLRPWYPHWRVFVGIPNLDG
jgi:hypothetical protein